MHIRKQSARGLCSSPSMNWQLLYCTQTWSAEAPRSGNVGQRGAATGRRAPATWEHMGGKVRRL